MKLRNNVEVAVHGLIVDGEKIEWRDIDEARYKVQAEGLPTNPRAALCPICKEYVAKVRLERHIESHGPQ